MNTYVRSLGISASLLSLFFLLQTQTLWAQASPVPRSVATTAVAAEPPVAGQIVSSTQVVPALPVPRLIKFSGALAKDASGQPRSGVVGITFSVYAEQQGGAPLWMETQNVQLDAHSHFAVLLGSSQIAGAGVAGERALCPESVGRGHGGWNAGLRLRSGANRFLFGRGERRGQEIRRSQIQRKA
jgi:hypothetical protein